MNYLHKEITFPSSDGKNTIHAAINDGKLIAYTYRGKRLISKADFIDYLAATTDDETAWQRRQRERISHDE